MVSKQIRPKSCINVVFYRKNIVKNTAPEGAVICVYGLVCSVNHVDKFNASVHIIGLS